MCKRPHCVGCLFNTQNPAACTSAEGCRYQQGFAFKSSTVTVLYQCKFCKLSRVHPDMSPPRVTLLVLASQVTKIMAAVGNYTEASKGRGQENKLTSSTGDGGC